MSTRQSLIHLCFGIVAASPVSILAADHPICPKELQTNTLSPGILQLCMTEAEAGSTGAQLQVGLHHYFSRDYDSAMRWYRKAAEAGNPKGQSLIAGLYLAGAGVPPDNVEACAWMTAAADMGDKKTENMLNSIVVPLLKKDQLKTCSERSKAYRFEK